MTMDMAEMYLTEKKSRMESSFYGDQSLAGYGSTGGVSFSAPVSPVSSPPEGRKLEKCLSIARSRHESMKSSDSAHENIEKLEMLLEAYFVVIDSTLNKLTSLKEYIDDTEDFINIQLEESKKKQESSTMQMDRHTMGPMSFVRKQYELQQKDAEKKPPSQACMYKETRKRKADNNYKTPFEHIKSNIDKMEEVQLERQVDGDSVYRGVMRSNNSKNHMQLRKCYVMSKGKSKRVLVGGIIILDEYL